MDEESPVGREGRRKPQGFRWKQGKATKPFFHESLLKTASGRGLRIARSTPAEARPLS